MKRAMLAAVVMAWAVAGGTVLGQAGGVAGTLPSETTGGSGGGPLAVMLERGIYLEQTAGDVEGAAKAYAQIAEQAAVTRGLAAQALARLAAVQAKQGKFADAGRTVDQLAREYPERTDLLQRTRAALPLQARGNAPGSDISARAAAAPPSPADKAEATKLAGEGWQAWKEGKYAEATETFRRALAKDDRSIDAHTGLGWSQLKLHNPTEAGKSFERALADPKNASALVGMGWVANDTNAGIAREYWKRALELSPNATAPLAALAQTSFQSHQYGQAADWYQRWLQIEPTSVDAKIGLERAQKGLAVAKEISAVAEDFFARLDAGRFEDMKPLLAPGARLRVYMGDRNIFGSRGEAPGDDGWQSAMTSYRAPLGKVLARRLDGVEGNTSVTNYLTGVFGTTVLAGQRAPGQRGRGPTTATPEYVRLTYIVQFEKKDRVTESVILGKVGEEPWRICTYELVGQSVSKDPLKAD